MRLTTKRAPFDRPIRTGTLHAGTAQIEIPVWAGLDLAGFIARENPCAGAHDALHARALAFCLGGRPALILTADCLGFSAEFVAAIHADFPDADVFLSATHTHAAPASQLLREAGTPDPAWMVLLHAALVDAGDAALRGMQPAVLFSGAVAPEKTVAINRRANGGDVSTELIDREVSVLQVRDAGGVPLANLVHFSCHPLVLGGENQLISADWPGAVCERVAAATGAVTLCYTGACGDINPARRGSWPELDWMAAVLTDAALRAIRDSKAVPVKGIVSHRERLRWACEPAPDAACLKAFIEEHAAKTPEHSTEARVIKAYITWANSALREGAARTTIDVECVELLLGDIALVGVPGELFVEIGMEMKALLLSAGFSNALICGYTNGNIGYIPTRHAYGAGGYEVEQAHRYYGTVGVVGAEAGESLVKRCRGLVPA